MIAVLGQSWALLLGMLLLMIGNGLQGTLLGVRGSLEEIDVATMGYIMSAYFVGFLVGSRMAPWMLQRVGHVRVFAALGSLASAAFILYGAAVDPLSWTVLRLIVGFCFSGLYVVAESWLNHSSSNETRGQALSLYMMVQMGGMVLGQLLLNVADPAGYGLFVLISVLVSIAVAPMLLSSSAAPHHQGARAMPLASLIRTSPLASVGMLLLGGVYAALYAMASVYATERGLSLANTSLFITAIFLGGMLFQYPIGWASDRLDRRWLIIGTTALGAACALFAALFGEHFVVLLVTALIIGGCAGPLYSLLVAYANDYLETEQMAAASGGLLFINGFGAMTGPVIVGWAMSTFGIEWYFLAIMLLLSAIGAYGLYRMTQRPHTVNEDPAPYLAISSRTSVVATEMAIEVADEAYLSALEEEEEFVSTDDDPEDAADLRDPGDPHDSERR